MKKFRYIGAVHIHTSCSDGSENLNTISLLAKKAGLDFIIVTDHNDLHIEDEGFVNGVAVIRGEEISPLKDNHYLALNINENIINYDDCNKNIEAVKTAGGFGFAAHPDTSENRHNSYAPILWTDKSAIPQGVEIWNWFSQWGDVFDERNIFTIAYSYLFKTKLKNEPYRKTLEWWDELNRSSYNIVPAIGGIDAHALRIKKYILPVTVFPYSFMFKTVINQVYLDTPLSNNFEVLKRQILNALKSGNNIVVNQLVSKNIPEITVCNNSFEAVCGENILLDNNTYMHLTSAKKAEFTVYKNGFEYAKCTTSNKAIKITESAKYRVEVKINGRGFAYTNPINVLGG